METVNLKDILYLIGALTAVISFVILLTKPFKEIRDQLRNHENAIKDLSDTIKIQQKLLNSSLKVQMLLMEHIIYGNHVEDIRGELKILQATILEINK